jgi:hypothetical protein
MKLVLFHIDVEELDDDVKSSNLKQKFSEFNNASQYFQTVSFFNRSGEFCEEKTPYLCFFGGSSLTYSSLIKLFSAFSPITSVGNPFKQPASSPISRYYRYRLIDYGTAERFESIFITAPRQLVKVENNIVLDGTAQRKEFCSNIIQHFTPKAYKRYRNYFKLQKKHEVNSMTHFLAHLDKNFSHSLSISDLVGARDYFSSRATKMYLTREYSHGQFSVAKLDKYHHLDMPTNIKIPEVVGKRPISLVVPRMKEETCTYINGML